ncbi:hypothetical protein CTI12_AA143570 [Artemisia annua]|uniref:Uncharacterized protein n=1 Tax=Artemisia annua TaxID=35608 RepID=A0A2U1PJI2_ARTAN|nr:hypothetical protein CTI12_AA143570 [Artemisia annua]
MNPFGTDLPLDNVEEDNNDHDHILGLFQKCYWDSQLSKTPLKSAEEFSKAISYSVTELALAGVKFKPDRDPKRVLEMRFKSSRSPCFCWSWESVLRNLIVYEQFSPTIPDYITSYAFAMERILDTNEDIIVKVIESKVLVNNLGSSEQASNMINSICKEVTVKDFLYIDQWKQLDAYYNGYWPRNIAWLRRTYFNTPWSFIALLAALFLFGLTVAQAYYTISPPA